MARPSTAPPSSAAHELTIDLNADLGESYGRWRLGNDEAMLEQVSSANVACGFHAGDPLTMRGTVRLAVRAGTAIGAHPSYPDLRGFGRRELALPADELEADLIYQLGALQGMARAEGGSVGYVKPHGALYHAMSRKESVARAVLAAAATASPALPVLLAAGSGAERVARSLSAPFAREAFVDRGYRDEGDLVPRGEVGDLITDPLLAARRAVALAVEGVVESVGGRTLELWPTSLCLHGDGPQAVAMARAVRGALEQAGVRVRPFTGP